MICRSFNPGLASMKALFLAHSPMLMNGTLASIDNVNVYSLICHMLGIQANPNNGSLTAWNQFLKTSQTVQ